MTTNSMALMALSSFGVGIIVALVTAIIVAPLSIFIVSFIQKNKLNKHKESAKKIIEEAETEAKNLRKEALIEAKD